MDAQEPSVRVVCMSCGDTVFSTNDGDQSVTSVLSVISSHRLKYGCTGGMYIRRDEVIADEVKDIDRALALLAGHEEMMEGLLDRMDALEARMDDLGRDLAHQLVIGGGT